MDLKRALGTDRRRRVGWRARGEPSRLDHTFELVHDLVAQVPGAGTHGGKNDDGG
jgi:hypothetical protein